MRKNNSRSNRVTHGKRQASELSCQCGKKSCGGRGSCPQALSGFWFAVDWPLWHGVPSVDLDVCQDLRAASEERMERLGVMLSRLARKKFDANFRSGFGFTYSRMVFQRVLELVAPGTSVFAVDWDGCGLNAAIRRICCEPEQIRRWARDPQGIGSHPNIALDSVLRLCEELGLGSVAMPEFSHKRLSWVASMIEVESRLVPVLAEAQRQVNLSPSNPIRPGRLGFVDAGLLEYAIADHAFMSRSLIAIRDCDGRVKLLLSIYPEVCERLVLIAKHWNSTIADVPYLLAAVGQIETDNVEALLRRFCCLFTLHQSTYFFARELYWQNGPEEVGNSVQFFCPVRR